jgi:hypothetical protein
VEGENQLFSRFKSDATRGPLLATNRHPSSMNGCIIPGASTSQEKEEGTEGKEGVMKTAVVLLAVGLAGMAGSLEAGEKDVRTCARLASYQKCDISRHEKGFLISLGHEVNGVVESAIREVTLIKLVQPASKSERIKEKLESLAASGRTPAIRVKALLGSTVYENPGWFTEEALVEYGTDDEVFGAILARLRGTVIASGF